MRVLSIEMNHRVILEVNSTELDNIINMITDDQYRIGYENGYNDWARIHDADVDTDNSKEN